MIEGFIRFKRMVPDKLCSKRHPWVAFGVMPLFALANAGVNLKGLSLNTGTVSGVVLGISLGLIFGKPLGILLISWLAVRFGLASLPHGVSWPGLLLVGCLAGIGFTMALFIAALAFPDALILSVAKLSVLIGSAVAAMAGLLVGRWGLPRDSGPSLQPTESVDR